jgi:23S rRNA pseudouridine2605 synthase
VRAPEGQDTVPDNLVDRLRRGVALEDGPAKFDEIERIGGTDSHDWYRVTLSEGRNREVRRLWESQGCQVSRLKRIRYGAIELPQPLLRGQSQELPDAQVQALRKQLGLEDGAPAALTLQPVIGQRKAAKATLQINARGAGNAYVNGHSTADEGRELRRFDHVREDRGRGRGKGGGFKGGLTVSGEAAAKQSQKPFKQRKEKGPKPLPEGNPAAFRSWYVPDGVDTGPSGHRNAGPKKPFGGKPAGGQRRGPGGGGGNSPYGGGFGDERGPRGQGAGQGQQRKAKPYGHPGNAPSFPSDHATPGSHHPYGQRQARPGGRPGGGNRPGGNGPRPGGNRGPGGRPGGAPRGRGPRGGGQG